MADVSVSGVHVSTAALSRVSEPSFATQPQPTPDHSRNDVSPRIDDIRIAPITIVTHDPLAEAAFGLRAAYDPRSLKPDATPRGVEIDRIEMIRQGFEHMRDIIRTISENAATVPTGGGVNITA